MYKDLQGIIVLVFHNFTYLLKVFRGSFKVYPYIFSHPFPVVIAETPEKFEVCDLSFGYCNDVVIIFLGYAVRFCVRICYKWFFEAVYELALFIFDRGVLCDGIEFIFIVFYEEIREI